MKVDERLLLPIERLKTSAYELHKLDELARTLINCDDYRSAFLRSADFFRMEGATGLNCGVFETKSGDPLGISTSMHPQFIQHYMDQNYGPYDPLVKLFPIMDGPYGFGFGGEVEELAKGQMSLAMLRDARDAGYSNIVANPVHLPSQCYSTCLVYANDMRGREANIFSSSKANFLSIGSTMVGQRLSELFVFDLNNDWIQLKRPPLTHQESEVVRWISVGLQNDEIAHRMRIANPTVHFHVNSAKAKLGAKTRAHLAAQALLRQLI